MQLLLNRKARFLWKWRRSLNLKTLFAMKMLCILMLAASLQIAARGYSQGISITLKNEPLEKLFTAVEQQTNFRFVYSQEAMELSKPVTIDVKNETLENILKLGFSNQSLTYSIVEKFIIVKIAEKKNEGAVLSHDVKGRVVNENGEGVVATITEKGTTNGVSTDADGYFLLKNADENATLIITGVGIETMEIKVAGKSNISIIAKTKITGLAEVIINKGYYSTSQKLNTGNVSKVTAETISKQPVSNPLAALSGRVPGLIINQKTGVPGGDFDVQIRGLNSIAGGNKPLFIIDGVPFTSTSLNSNNINNAITNSISPLNGIDPSDIESIEVLKDADATAIYGSRGANGVILITTKKGKAGRTIVDVNVYAGAGKVTRMLDMLNTQQYLQMRREAFKNDNTTMTAANAPDVLVWDTTKYTDWQKKLIGNTANVLNIQTSVSGGTNNTQFLIAGGYQKETTVFPGDFSDQKISSHFNVNHSSNNQKFKAILSAIYVSETNKLFNRDLTSFLTYVPNTPDQIDASGKLLFTSGVTNAFQYTKRKYKVNTDNLLVNTIISYEIIKDLQLRVSGGYTKTQMNEIQASPLSSFNPANGFTSGETYFSNSSIQSWIVEPQINFSKRQKGSQFNFIAGSTFQQDIRQGQTFYATGFSNDALLENIKAASTVTVQAADYTQYRYNAFFARLNYNLKERYILNLTARRDGSSRFGPAKQFSNFGAIGAAWIFSNEKFIAKSFTFLSYGKLRGSYGTTGNDQIPDYGFWDSYSPTSFPYQGNGGLQSTRLFNPDYAWERNKKLEAAIDLGFIKDRLFMNVSWYRNRSNNQLVGYPLPPSTGFPTIQYYNLQALVQNSGWEFEINSNNIKNKNFTWRTAFNLSVPKNKLVSFPNLSLSSYANKYEIGKPLTLIKSYHFLGVDPQTGVYKYEDVNKDGQITTPDDLMAIKKVAQDYYGGLQNSFAYKGIQIDIFFQFVKQTGYNYLNNFSFPGSRSNQPIVVLNHWQKPGDITNIEKFTRNAGSPAGSAYLNYLSLSDQRISDASFIRLKNLSASYTLPNKLINKIKIQNTRIYIQGQNLITITNYLGLDPETQYLFLPPLRVLTTGIQITF